MQKKLLQKTEIKAENTLALKFLKVKAILDNSWVSIMEEKSKEVIPSENFELTKCKPNKKVAVISLNKLKEESYGNLFHQLDLGNMSNCQPRNNQELSSRTIRDSTFLEDIKNSPVKENIYRDNKNKYSNMSVDKTEEIKKTRRTRNQRSNSKIQPLTMERCITWKILRSPNLATNLKKKLVRNHLNELYKKVLTQIKLQEKYKKYINRSSRLKA